MKKYHIYIGGPVYVGSVSPQLLTRCIQDFEKFGYPWMAQMLRELRDDAKERAKPDHPPVRPLSVNEVQAINWGKAIRATKATAQAFDCTAHKERHGLFLGWSEQPLPDPDTVRCAHCQRPY